MALIKLSRRAYEDNLAEIARRAGGVGRLICVFKDNAYGHGARILAPVARERGVAWVAVKDEAEAVELENFFPHILILSHRPSGAERANFIYAINEFAHIKSLKKGTRIHLKIDTGMHRHGIGPEDLALALKEIKRAELVLEGVFTHFSSSDELDEAFRRQEKRFAQAKDFFKNYGSKLVFHSYNSATLFSSRALPSDELCRVGMAQFGYGAEGLRRVLSLHAHKLSSRILPKHHGVGYNSAFIAQSEIKIATYDLGYADGLLRYGGVGRLLLASGRPMLGKMSMDSFSCEDEGDEICVFDDANVWAHFFHTINYEVLVKLQGRIPRVLV